MTYIADAESQTFREYIKRDPVHLLIQYGMMMRGSSKAFQEAQRSLRLNVPLIKVGVDLEVEANALYHALMHKLGVITSVEEYVESTKHALDEWERDHPAAC